MRRPEPKRNNGFGSARAVSSSSSDDGSAKALDWNQGHGDRWRSDLVRSRTFAARRIPVGALVAPVAAWFLLAGFGIGLGPRVWRFPVLLL